MITRYSPQHIHAVWNIYAKDIKRSPANFELSPASLESYIERCETINKENPFILFLDEGTAVGFAYASQHRAKAAYQWSREVSIYVADTHQNKGIATKLYTALIELLKFQGASSALAGITVPNPSSIALHERFGFKEVAHYKKMGFKRGRWHDVKWLSLDLNPQGLPPVLQLLDMETIWSSPAIKELNIEP